ncbi:hypothetical protein PF005_g25674 [Phytophthora fragariae]|uniref:Uncharacterized protein n=1 Tax=Phytophthora fragariae TaxID=53985 RepID=A0A6A3VWM8_9STRA|nr:hypothetical protein PF009_g16015 [Phytophthora fragariae]KAE9174838.1 hypothetical protein PF005_g25674 [Phytophthora fragariae]
MELESSMLPPGVDCVTSRFVRCGLQCIGGAHCPRKARRPAGCGDLPLVMLHGAGRHQPWSAWDLQLVRLAVQLLLLTLLFEYDEKLAYKGLELFFCLDPPNVRTQLVINLLVEMTNKA